MRHVLKTVIALVATASLPLIAVAPASAAVNPDLSTFNFDCVDHFEDGWTIPLYGDSIEITFTNCDQYGYIYDDSGSGNASTTAGAITDTTSQYFDTVTVDGEADLRMYDAGDYYFADLNVRLPYNMADPEGVQLADSLQVIDADSPATTTYGTQEEIDADNEIGIGGDTEHCGILPGEHVYATQEVTVHEAGDYTVRVTGVDPGSYYLNRLDFERNPLRDPMVAIYSAFDPSDPNDGNVSCNDDLNDLVIDSYDFGDNDFNLTEQGDFLEGHFSYLTATLEPGVYTFVFTTWDAISGDEWVAGSDGNDNWTPSEGTIYFDIWGPEGGLELGDTLAATGVDPSFGLWTGLALVGTGVAITAARRRAVRA